MGAKFHDLKESVLRFTFLRRVTHGVSQCLEGICADFWGRFRIQPVASRFPLDEDYLDFRLFQIVPLELHFCDFCILLELTFEISLDLLPNLHV